MRRKNMMLLTTAAIICTQILMACGGLSSKQKTDASEAIAALRKLEAAVQVGVNYQQYGILLIDAKAKVNDANAVLTDGELKKELNAVMDAYADAAQAWNTKVSSTISLKPDTEPGATLMRRYNIKPKQVSTVTYLSGDEVMQAAWGTAHTHLEQATSLLNQ